MFSHATLQKNRSNLFLTLFTILGLFHKKMVSVQSINMDISVLTMVSFQAVPRARESLVSNRSNA